MGLTSIFAWANNKIDEGKLPVPDLFSWCSGRSGCAPGRSGTGWQVVAGPGRC